MAYKVLKSEPDHFVVDDGKGPFKIAKRGLGGATLMRLHKMHGEGAGPKEELHAAEGAEVPETEEEKLSALGVPDPGAAGPQGDTGPQASFAPPADVGLQASFAPPGTVPGPTGGVAEGPDQNFTPGPAAPTPVPTSQPAAPAPAGGGSFGSPGQYMKAAGAEAEATKGRGQAEAEQARTMAAAQQQANERRAQADAIATQHFAESKAQIDADRQAVASGKIDPNQWWHSRNTGQQISGAIAMLLGGIGSGLTGQPNVAHQMIQAAIGRDIEAQKANLGIKQSLLSNSLAQGHMMMDADNMARMRMEAGIAGQIQAAAYSSQDPVAIARANEAANTHYANSVAIASQLASQAADRAMKAKELERMDWQIKWQQNMMGIQAKANSGQPLNQNEAAMFGLSGEKSAGLLYNLGDGTSRVALDEASRTKLADMDAKTTEFAKLLQDPTRGALAKLPGSVEATKANDWHDEVVQSLKALKGTSERFNEKEFEILAKRVPDYTAWVQNPAKADTQLKGLYQEVLRHRASAQSAYLRGGAGGGSGT